MYDVLCHQSRSATKLFCGCVQADRCEWRIRWDPELNPVGLHVNVCWGEKMSTLVCHCHSRRGSLGPSTVILMALWYVATWGGLVNTVMVKVKLFPVTEKERKKRKTCALVLGYLSNSLSSPFHLSSTSLLPPSCSRQISSWSAKCIKSCKSWTPDRNKPDTTHTHTEINDKMTKEKVHGRLNYPVVLQWWVVVDHLCICVKIGHCCCVMSQTKF